MFQVPHHGSQKHNVSPSLDPQPQCCRSKARARRLGPHAPCLPSQERGRVEEGSLGFTSSWLLTAPGVRRPSSAFHSHYISPSKPENDKFFRSQQANYLLTQGVTRAFHGSVFSPWTCFVIAVVVLMFSFFLERKANAQN